MNYPYKFFKFFIWFLIVLELIPTLIWTHMGSKIIIKKKKLKLHTSSLHVCFPFWGRHSGWQAMHSPLDAANSRGSLWTHAVLQNQLSINLYSKYIKTKQFYQAHWPRVEVAVRYTGAMPTVIPARQTLLRPRAPASCIWAQRVTHMALFLCLHMNGHAK